MDWFDPMLWMSALGTGANLYTNYNNRQIQNAYDRAQAQRDAQNAAIAAQNAQLAAQANQFNMGNAAAYNRAISGYPSMWGNMLSSYMGALLPMIGGIGKYAMSPMNVGKYMQNLSDMEKMAILRQPYAALAARGIQPGGYWDQVTASTLAQDAKERYGVAVDAASKEKTMTLQGLEAMLRGMPGMPNLPMPIAPSYFNPQMVGYTPSVGSAPNLRWPTSDPLSDYLKTLAIRRAPTTFPSGAGDVPNTSSMNNQEYSDYLNRLIQEAMYG